jgi:hypothetical protein
LITKEAGWQHLFFKDEVQDTMAIRIFNGLDGQGGAEDNWGMDLDIPDWIQEVKGVYQGQRCFILGTGPSLAKELPLLPRMADEETFTVNRMRNFKELPFTPRHHLVAEPGPIMEWGRVVNPVYDYPTAPNRIAVNWWPVYAPGWLWCPKAPDDIQIRWEGFFGLGDTFPPIPTGWASPLTSAQIAAWMGFTEIFFLGIDTTQGGQAWDAENGRTRFPRNIRSIVECFERAGRDMKRAGRKMYDCSQGGRINAEGALEYIALSEVLA